MIIITIREKNNDNDIINNTNTNNNTILRIIIIKIISWPREYPIQLTYRTLSNQYQDRPQEQGARQLLYSPAGDVGQPVHK